MTAEHVRLGGEIQQETAGVSENHTLLCTTPGVVAVETFGTVSTSWMLMTKLDGLIHELRGEWIWDVLWNAFHVHRQLWSLWIKHRDISCGNITIWKDPVAGDNTARTGSFVFQAVSIYCTKGIAHVYEHDIESFFWVAMWVVFCCGDGPLAPDCPLLKWGKVESRSFVRHKAWFWDWFSHFERSPNAKLRTQWNRWDPLFSITEVFTRPGFSPTDDAVKLYTKLLTAKLEGEQSVR